MRDLNLVYESKYVMIIEDYEDEKLIFICKNKCSYIYYGCFSFDLEDIIRCFNEITTDLSSKDKVEELDELKDSQFYKETIEYLNKE